MLTPSRLVIARKRQGLTLTRLAELTGLSTRSISMYENGHAEPSEDTLRHLADVLQVSAAFLDGADVDEIPEEAVSFRALSKMTARQRDRALSAGRVALLINDWIDERFELPAAGCPEPDRSQSRIRRRSRSRAVGSRRAADRQPASPPRSTRCTDLLPYRREQRARRLLALLAPPALHLPEHRQKWRARPFRRRARAGSSRPSRRVPNPQPAHRRG